MSEKSEKNGLEKKDTIIAACDFCEALFHMGKAELEIAIERQLDILCDACAKKLDSTPTEHAEYEGLGQPGKITHPAKKRVCNHNLRDLRELNTCKHTRVQARSGKRFNNSDYLYSVHVILLRSKIR